MKRRALSLIGGVVAISLLIWFLSAHAEELTRIKQVSALDLTFLSILTIGIFVINGLLIRSYCLFFERPLKPVEWFGLSIVQTMGNYIPLRGGGVAQMVYVKLRHGLALNKLLAGLSITMVLSFLVGGVLGLLAMGLVVWQYAHFNWKLFAIFAAVACLATVLLIAPFLAQRFVLLFRLRPFCRVGDFMESWEAIRSDGALVRQLMILSASGIMIYGLRLYTAYHALGYQVPIGYCLVIAPLGTISMMLSISPAGLGVREAAVGMASALLGFGLSNGVYAAALDRAVSMVWVFILGTFFSYVLTSRVLIGPGE
ncbi:flippase-like domain-containing protein [Acidobacteria bacterium AH-259-D05]|nr:flippase-like domain-containing protein [Acidobacteria bacterium AH-259-D05]